MASKSAQNMLAHLANNGGGFIMPVSEMKKLFGDDIEVELESAKNRSLVTSRYTNIQGQDSAQYTVSITEKGRLALQEMRQRESEEPDHKQLRDLAESIEHGDYEDTRAVAVVFDNGFIYRLGVGRDKGIAAVFAAAVKAGMQR